MPNENLPAQCVRLIPAQFVHEAVAAARSHGADWEGLLKAADIDPALDRPVHIEQFARLWKSVGRAIDDDVLDLGARPLPCGGLGFLAHGAIHATSFRQAMVSALDYLRILIDRPRARLVVEDNLAKLVFNDDDEGHTSFAYHLVWIIVGGLTGWLVGRRVALRHVDFRCPPPPESMDYRDIIRAPVRFSQPRSRFLFYAEDLDMPVIRTPHSLVPASRAR